MRKIVLFLLFLCLFMIGFVWAYFEDKYYCNIWQTQISVSLKLWDWYQKCMTLLYDMKYKIKNLEENILSAEWYVKKWDDVKYWNKLIDEFQVKINSLIKTRESIIKYMRNFESTLFLKIKKLLYYNLKKDKGQVDKESLDIDLSLNDAIQKWDIIKYQQYKKQYDYISLKSVLIDRILITENFNDMIPLLRVYINDYYK